MQTKPRSKLAVIGGFRRPREAAAAGSLHASFLICQAIAKEGGYSELHLYQDDPHIVSRDNLVVPPSPPTRVLGKALLSAAVDTYSAIYVANGEQAFSVPYVLRPHEDWAPVICSVGTTHARTQWQNLLTALACGSVRASDGFIFKAQATRDLFRSVWNEWCQRLGVMPAFPETSTVIPNGVDVELNRKSASFREETRRRLRVAPDDVLFLGFSRLSPGSKGDQLALVVRWAEVVERFPQALLALTGAGGDRAFLVELRETARAAGISHRVLVLEDPFEVVAQAQQRLMSAADVFLHLTTGLEETSPLVVHEAMAHSLPVVATDWAGLREVVHDGENGYLIASRSAATFPGVRDAIFGANDRGLIEEASRWVYCDWQTVVARAVALADPEKRRTMGEAARRGVEQRSIAAIARRYVDFFAQVSVEAQRSWPGESRFRPLVDLDRVLQAMASATLASTERVRLARPSRAALLTAGSSEEKSGHLAALFQAFEDRKEWQLGTLAVALLTSGQGPAAQAAPEQAFRITSRFLVRLLNFGVLEPVPSDARSAPRL